MWASRFIEGSGVGQKFWLKDFTKANPTEAFGRTGAPVKVGSTQENY